MPAVFYADLAQWARIRLNRILAGIASISFQAKAQHYAREEQRLATHLFVPA